jgi:hypothetical protein
MRAFAQRRVTVVQAPPRCSEHELALELTLVEISKDND